MGLILARTRTLDRSRSLIKSGSQREEFMEAAIDRIMMTYDLLLNRSAAASAEARK